jgi:GNAT superfamily N-acetyltransferase
LASPERQGRAAAPARRGGGALEVRELARAELPAAVQLLARAMRDDPMYRAVFGADAEHRLGRLRRFFGALLPLMGRPPLSAWDAGRLVGVLGQFPPGTCRTPLRQQVRIALPLLSLNVGELWRLWRWVGASEAHDLAVRHWHLGPVAVDADWQGRGIGSRMLRAFCARMDEWGEVAFLETDKLASVRFYARSGFKLTARADVLGTPNWWLHRPPRTLGAERA